MDTRSLRSRAQESQQHPTFLYPLDSSMSSPQASSQSPFTSSSSLASMTSVDTNSRQSPAMEQQLQQTTQHGFRGESAPMPSPSHSRMEQHNPFDNFNVQASLRLQAVQEQRQQATGQRAAGYHSHGPRGSPETESFLSNLNLVAEAAKRAQMACMMRDFGEVEL